MSDCLFMLSILIWFVVRFARMAFQLGNIPTYCLCPLAFVCVQQMAFTVVWMNYMQCEHCLFNCTLLLFISDFKWHKFHQIELNWIFNWNFPLDFLRSNGKYIVIGLISICCKCVVHCKYVCFCVWLLMHFFTRNICVNI